MTVSSRKDFQITSFDGSGFLQSNKKSFKISHTPTLHHFSNSKLPASSRPSASLWLSLLTVGSRLHGMLWVMHPRLLHRLNRRLVCLTFFCLRIYPKFQWTLQKKGVLDVNSRGLGSPNHQWLEIPWFLGLWNFAPPNSPPLRSVVSSCKVIRTGARILVDFMCCTGLTTGKPPQKGVCFMLVGSVLDGNLFMNCDCFGWKLVEVTNRMVKKTYYVYGPQTCDSSSIYRFAPEI